MIKYNMKLFKQTSALKVLSVAIGLLFGIGVTYTLSATASKLDDYLSVNTGATFNTNLATTKQVAIDSNTGNVTIGAGLTATTGTFIEAIGTLGSRSGQFRAVAGSYGVMLRNDGAATYLLPTASGDQYGSWSTLRPFSFSNSTGLVSMLNGLTATTGTFYGDTTLGDAITDSHKINGNLGVTGTLRNKGKDVCLNDGTNCPAAAAQTSYFAGSGLTLSGTSFSLNPSISATTGTFSTSLTTNGQSAPASGQGIGTWDMNVGGTLTVPNSSAVNTIGGTLSVTNFIVSKKPHGSISYDNLAVGDCYPGYPCATESSCISYSCNPNNKNSMTATAACYKKITGEYASTVSGTLPAIAGVEVATYGYPNCGYDGGSIGCAKWNSDGTASVKYYDYVPRLKKVTCSW